MQRQCRDTDLSDCCILQTDNYKAKVKKYFISQTGNVTIVNHFKKRENTLAERCNLSPELSEILLFILLSDSTSGLTDDEVGMIYHDSQSFKTVCYERQLCTVRK